MQVMDETPDDDALDIDESASVLGFDEFSLVSRIQAGEINAVRSPAGEMLIPGKELQRLVGAPIKTSEVATELETTELSDECLGIRPTYRGLRPRQRNSRVQDARLCWGN